MRYQTILLCALTCFIPACQPQKSTLSANGGNPPPGSALIQGKATVLEVHNELGFALLDFDGKQLYGYWEADPTTAQAGTITQTGPWGTAVGVGNQPLVHHQDFPAKPGDTIAFRGLRTGADIYLTGVQLLPTK